MVNQSSTEVCCLDTRDGIVPVSTINVHLTRHPSHNPPHHYTPSADRRTDLHTQKLKFVGGLAHRQFEKAVACGWASPGCH